MAVVKNWWEREIEERESERKSEKVRTRVWGSGVQRKSAYLGTKRERGGCSVGSYYCMSETTTECQIIYSSLHYHSFILGPRSLHVYSSGTIDVGAAEGLSAVRSVPPCWGEGKGEGKATCEKWPSSWHPTFALVFTQIISLFFAFKFVCSLFWVARDVFAWKKKKIVRVGLVGAQPKRSFTRSCHYYTLVHIAYNIGATSVWNTVFYI